MCTCQSADEIFDIPNVKIKPVGGSCRIRRVGINAVVDEAREMMETAIRKIHALLDKPGDTPADSSFILTAKFAIPLIGIDPSIDENDIVSLSRSSRGFSQAFKDMSHASKIVLRTAY